MENKKINKNNRNKLTEYNLLEVLGGVKKEIIKPEQARRALNRKTFFSNIRKMINENPKQDS